MRTRLVLSTLILGFGALRPAHAAIPTQPSLVTVSGQQLIVRKRLSDGTLDVARPYTIRGVNWQPATFSPTTGPNPLSPSLAPVQYGCFFDFAGRAPQGHEVMGFWTKNEFAAHYQTDIPLLRQMHVNTVRVFSDFGPDPASKEILDALYAADIMVIMTVSASSGDYTGASPAYLESVNRMKNHPAILMWSLGNEWNLNSYFGSYATMSDAIAGTQAAAVAVHAADTSHPVSSSLGDVFSVTTGNPNPCLNGTLNSDIPTVVAGVPAVDVWGLNIYRGVSFGSLFTQWSGVTSKPFFLGEFGIDSFATTQFTTPFAAGSACGDSRAQVTAGNDDSATQSTWDIGLWHEITPHLSADQASGNCLGGAVFAFNDEPWEVGNYNVGLGGLGNGLCNGYDPGGFVFAGGAYPDGVANEEYYGIVDASRKPKIAYYTLQSYYQSLAPSLTPTIDYFAPPSLPVGGSSVVETIHGSHFASDAYVLWNGVAKPTTVLNSSEVQWTVSAADLAQPAHVNVFVVNPSTGAATSEAAIFPIQTISGSASARVSPDPWRSDQDRGIPITFDQLAPGSTVKIFTLSGRWVRTLDASPGYVDWDLKNDDGNRVASGIYLYLISGGSGSATHGKFAIIQ